MDGWFELGLGSSFSEKKHCALVLGRSSCLTDIFQDKKTGCFQKSSYENLVNLIIASDKMPPIREAGLMQLGTSVSSRSQDSLFESGDFPVQARHKQTTALLCWVSIFRISRAPLRTYFLGNF